MSTAKDVKEYPKYFKIMIKQYVFFSIQTDDNKFTY